MKKNDIKNLVWNTIGTMIFGFTSLFYMIIITRINGVNDAGIYSYAFANACVFTTIGFFAGRTFQVTEQNKEISDTDYLYNHITTFIIMMLCVLFFCLLTRPGVDKFILIILLSLYRGIETIIDSIHAIIQRNEELYKVGISLLLRTILLVTSLILIDGLTKNMYLACSSLILINLFFCIFIDFRNIKNNFSKTKFSFSKNNYLLKTGLAVFLYSFLNIYIINSTKYAINFFANDEMQAIYGIISMPASFLVLVSNYILQPFLNKMTNFIKEKDIKALKKMVYKLCAGIIAIGILAILICSIIGIPVLEFVYGIDLSGQKINLNIVLIGSIFYSLTILMSAVFIAIRKTVSQLMILIITSIVSLVCSNILVFHYSIIGASISYALIMFVEFLLHYILLNIRLKKLKEEDK